MTLVRDYFEFNSIIVGQFDKYKYKNIEINFSSLYYKIKNTVNSGALSMTLVRDHFEFNSIIVGQYSKYKYKIFILLLRLFKNKKYR